MYRAHDHVSDAGDQENCSFQAVVTIHSSGISSPALRNPSM
jgi:hypothetical protein